MAIRLELAKTAKPLFCESKFWGDPDMSPDMEYPMMTILERPDGSAEIVRDNAGEHGGETYEYPLTFICQIRCEDIVPFDPDGRLPHDGMLYFFAAMDEYTGYDSPVHLGEGEWPKGSVVVKYAKTINMETFQACMMVDDDDSPLTEPALEIRFSSCGDDADGLKLLGMPHAETVHAQYPNHVNLLQLDGDETAGITFPDSGMLNFIITETDFGKGLLKRPKAVLSHR